MRPLIANLEPDSPLCAPFTKAMRAEHAFLELRRFPDGETYLRFKSDVSKRHVILLCSLDRPDDKFVRLAFAAATARDLGAKSVGLVCPYLAYMRQDARFVAGEAVSSVCFAKLLSSQADWLVTVDPHLHRHKSLSDFFEMPTVAVQSAPLMGDWIRRFVERPLLVGPDEESVQWVAAVARETNAPQVVLNKIRSGDRDIEIRVPELDHWRGHTPVLVDDIISTGRTMIETTKALKRAGLRSPICVGVHGVFADTACQQLLDAGVQRVVTSNTVKHETNAFDVSGILAAAVSDICGLKP